MYWMPYKPGMALSNGVLLSDILCLFFPFYVVHHTANIAIYLSYKFTVYLTIFSTPTTLVPTQTLSSSQPTLSFLPGPHSNPTPPAFSSIPTAT